MQDATYDTVYASRFNDKAHIEP